MDINNIINAYAEDRDLYFSAVAPPIVQTSNFAFDSVEGLRNSFKDEYAHYLYSRGINPTVDILRKKLAALDQAEDCLVFNSGAAAIFAAVLANVKSGDHIVSVRSPYTWTRRLFDEILPRFNVSTTYVDGRIEGIFETETRSDTVLYYLESPLSWYFELQDLSQIAKAAKARNILTICDNSYCSPIYQKPIALGIDLSVQSGTKYTNGHSDVLAGILSGSRPIIERIFNSEYMNIGSGIQPFSAWLLLRGLRTLTLRLQKSSSTALSVIDYLKSHPRVEAVRYPMDDGFEQYELARKQMSGAGGLFSFYLKVNDIRTIETFVQSLRHFLIAVSWGGYESLVFPNCATVESAVYNALLKEQRLIRMYVGLEEPNYLIADLHQAFETISTLP